MKRRELVVIMKTCVAALSAAAKKSVTAPKASLINKATLKGMTVKRAKIVTEKAEIWKILPDVSPTTVEAVLGAMVKSGAIKRIGASRAVRYIKNN